MDGFRKIRKPRRRWRGWVGELEKRKGFSFDEYGRLARKRRDWKMIEN